MRSLNPRKVVVFVWSQALGDTLMLVPTLRELRKAYPEATLELFGGREPGRLLASTDLVDGASSVEDPSLAGIATGSVQHHERMLQALHRPDLVIAFSRETSAAQASLSRLRVPHLVTTPEPPYGVHTAAHLLSALGPLGIDTEWEGPGAVEPLGSQAAVPQLDDPQLVAIHPGSGGRWKCAPPSLFGLVARRLQSEGHRVVVVQGPADSDQVRAMDWGGELVVTGDLPTLHHLLSSAAAFIGNDSGATHLASLLGTPTVGLFGPTHPTTWHPLGPHVEVVRTCTRPPGPSIRICDDPNCLESITPEMVLAALRRVEER